MWVSAQCLIADFEVLAAQGMQPNQQVTFLTDGGDDIRDLPRYLNPQAEHLLDWFHLTMRITVLTQLAKGVRCPPKLPTDVTEELQRVKWFLWHGNVFRARQTVDDLIMDITDADGSVELAKLGKAVREFGGYLTANASCIPNYGERRLAGETISTSFVESAVNQVISKRMVKKQQMRWSPRGAHLLLQIRTRVLNDTFTDDDGAPVPRPPLHDRPSQAAYALPRFVPLSALTATATENRKSGSVPQRPGGPPPRLASLRCHAAAFVDDFDEQVPGLGGGKRGKW